MVTMRRALSSGALLLSLLLAVTGCDFLTGIVDPLIGSWVRSQTDGTYTMTTTFTFHADNTWEQVTTQTGYTDRTVSGIYTHDPEVMILTLSALSGGTGTIDFTYAIGSDRKTLTLWVPGGSIDFSRK